MKMANASERALCHLWRGSNQRVAEWESAQKFQMYSETQENKRGDLQGENLELQSVTLKQLDAIQMLKEEAIALRADLAFVGEQVAVTVTPENPGLNALEQPNFNARPPNQSFIDGISSQTVGPVVDGSPAPSNLPVHEVILSPLNCHDHDSLRSEVFGYFVLSLTNGLENALV